MIMSHEVKAYIEESLRDEWGEKSLELFKRIPQKDKSEASKLCLKALREQAQQKAMKNLSEELRRIAEEFVELIGDPIAAAALHETLTRDEQDKVYAALPLMALPDSETEEEARLKEMPAKERVKAKWGII